MPVVRPAYFRGSLRAGTEQLGERAALFPKGQRVAGSQGGEYSAGGFEYSTAVAFSCRAASMPASEDSKTSTPSINSDRQLRSQLQPGRDALDHSADTGCRDAATL